LGDKLKGGLKGFPTLVIAPAFLKYLQRLETLNKLRLERVSNLGISSCVPKVFAKVGNPK